jgi:hypothetical protein
LLRSEGIDGNMPRYGRRPWQARVVGRGRADRWANSDVAGRRVMAWHVARPGVPLRHAKYGARTGGCGLTTTCAYGGGRCGVALADVLWSATMVPWRDIASFNFVYSTLTDRNSKYSN